MLTKFSFFKLSNWAKILGLLVTLFTCTFCGQDRMYAVRTADGMAVLASDTASSQTANGTDNNNPGAEATAPSPKETGDVDSKSNSDSGTSDQNGTGASGHNNVKEEHNGDHHCDGDKDKLDANHKKSHPKIIICHRAGNSGQSITLNVSASALPAHMRHGDKPGPC